MLRKTVVTFLTLMLLLPQVLLFAQQDAWQHQENSPGQAVSHFKQGEAALKESDYIGALILFEEASKVYMQFFGADHPALAKIYKAAAESLANYGHLLESLQYCQKAIQVLEKNTLTISPDYLLVCMATGDIHRRIGQPLQAVKHYEKVKKALLVNPHLDITSENLLMLNLHLGNIYFEQQKYFEAILAFEDALSFLTSEIKTDKNHNIAVLHGNIGRAYFEAGEIEKALFHIHKSLNIYQNIFGKVSEQVATLYKTLAIFHFSETHFDSTWVYAHKAIQTFEKMPGNHKQTLLEFKVNLANQFFVHGFYATAALWYKEVLQDIKKDLRENKEKILIEYVSIAQYFAAEYQVHEAIDFYLEGMAYCEEVFGTNDFRRGNLARQIAHTYEKIENIEKANQYLTISLQIAEKNPAKDSVQLVDDYQKAAEFNTRLGHTAEAIHWLEKTVGCLSAFNNRKASLYYQLAMGYYRMDSLEKAIHYASLENQFYQRVYDGNHIYMFKSCLLMGNLHYRLNEPEKAIQFYQQALRYNPKAFSSSDPVSREAASLLGTFFMELGQQTPEILQQNKALQLLYQKSVQSNLGY
jgi:tetratricopeptide (TPR) repeat protein